MWVQGEGAGSNGPRGTEELNHHGLLAANIWHRASPTSTISTWLRLIGLLGLDIMELQYLVGLISSLPQHCLWILSEP